MRKILIFVIVSYLIYGCQKDTKDRRLPASVTICNQEWATKNLDVSFYRNGDAIPQVTDPSAWTSLTTGAWCWYNNDSGNYAVYGKLYNWHAVNDPRGLSPEGWHIPSDDEWSVLTTCLGEAVAGGKLKEKGYLHWLEPNTGATNSTGFTALGGGTRTEFGEFGADRFFGFWWSTTENVSSYAFDRLLLSFGANIYKEITGHNKNNGFSVRCLRN